MFRPFFLVSLFLFTPITGAANSPDPNPKSLAVTPAKIAQAKDLVAKLASESFEEREEAHENLAKMGRLAMPALIEGLRSSPSPEVRHRCQALLPKAAQDDLQARLDTFLADVDNKYQHDMPGWNEFRKVVGNSTASSRKVFVELLKDPSNQRMVLGVARTSGELGSLIASRKSELFQNLRARRPNTIRKQPAILDILALMFAESFVPSSQVPGRASNSIYNASGLNRAISEGSEKSRIYRAIVGHWIETRDDATSMYSAMNQANTLGLKREGNIVASRLLKTKTATVYYRFYAAFALARNNAKDHLADLESVFSDDSSLNQRMVVRGKIANTQKQLRDMALVSALLITGQKAEEYGFQELHKNNPGMQFVYSNWVMPEDKRKAAFAKWKIWRTKHPDLSKDVKKK